MEQTIGGITLEQVMPQEIEKRSFEIIREELGDRTFPADQEPVILRAIHTAADFDYADNLCFSENAVKIAKELIMTAGVPYIVARGRKGGSNVAAAICNALLYQINNER